jgi:hypothetical protein
VNCKALIIYWQQRKNTKSRVRMSANPSCSHWLTIARRLCLNPWQNELFMRMLRSSVPYFGHRVLSRVEGSHRTLRQYIRSLCYIHIIINQYCGRPAIIISQFLSQCQRPDSELFYCKILPRVHVTPNASCYWQEIIVHRRIIRQFIFICVI